MATLGGLRRYCEPFKLPSKVIHRYTNTFGEQEHRLEARVLAGTGLDLREVTRGHSREAAQVSKRQPRLLPRLSKRLTNILCHA